MNWELTDHERNRLERDCRESGVSVASPRHRRDQARRRADHQGRRSAVIYGTAVKKLSRAAGDMSRVEAQGLAEAT